MSSSSPAPGPIRIAGVPEAFNDPFSAADFSGHGLTTTPQFISTPGGSGAMLKSVLTGAVDAAFMLTDCVVAAIENGDPLRLAGPLVTTPLTWAVIVAPSSPTMQIADLSAARWGVSRMGSGSQVMARLVAAERAWPDPTFVVCGDFATLRARLQAGEIDVFLWEHFTTKPYADAGTVRFIGGVPTPWPCFSVAVRADFERGADLRRAVDAFVEAGTRFVDGGRCAQQVADKHGMKVEDARAWAAGVRYAAPGTPRLDADVLEGVRKALRDAGVIASAPEGPDRGTDWYSI